MLYESYIASPQWKQRRQKVLERDSFQCQACLSSEDLEVHHKTYARLGHEDLDDLITFCHDCHEAITTVIRRRKYKSQSLKARSCERSTPIIRRVLKYAEIKIQAAVRGTPHPPQRANERSLELILKANEANQREEREDGRRF